MKPTISLLLIATNKYKTFVAPLLKSAAEFFFVGHKVKIVIFTDQPDYFNYLGDDYLHHFASRFNIRFVKIPSYTFPTATLYRYKIFSENVDKITGHYVFYCDVDMRFEDFVQDDILQDGLIATCHPGFFKGGGSWCEDPKSTAFTPEVNRQKYYAGGFQAGDWRSYMKCCFDLAKSIATDEMHGVKAEHNDEHHWNRYISEAKNYKVLTPEYCQVEEWSLREEWKVSELKPKIVALSKNHEEIRKI